MGEYFKPWRRRFGLMTLVMACVFLGLWVRSLAIYDCAICYCGLHTRHTVFSASHFIGYQYIYERLPERHPIFVRTNWGSNTPADGASHLFADTRITWHWRWYGFSDCEYLENRLNGCRCRIWIAPYWSIVIPLTMLTAFLLLSKPRKSTSDKLDEPVPEKVA